MGITYFMVPTGKMNERLQLAATDGSVSSIVHMSPIDQRLERNFISEPGRGPMSLSNITLEAVEKKELTAEEQFVLDTLDKNTIYSTRYPSQAKCDSVLLRARAHAIEEDLVALDRGSLIGTTDYGSWGGKFNNRWVNYVKDRQMISGIKTWQLAAIINRTKVHHRSWEEPQYSTKRRCLTPQAYLVKSPMKMYGASSWDKITLTAFTVGDGQQPRQRRRSCEEDSKDPNEPIVQNKRTHVDKAWIYTTGTDIEKQFEYSGKLHESMDRARHWLERSADLGSKPDRITVNGAAMKSTKIPVDQIVSLEDMVAFCRVVFTSWTIIYRPEMSPFAVFDRINKHSFKDTFWKHCRSTGLSSNIQDHGDCDSIEFLAGVPHYKNKIQNSCSEQYWRKTFRRLLHKDETEGKIMTSLMKLGEGMKAEDSAMRKEFHKAHKAGSEDDEASTKVISDEILSFGVRFIIGPRDVLMWCNHIVSTPTAEAINIAWRWFWSLLRLFVHSFKPLYETVQDVKGQGHKTSFMKYTNN